MLSKILPLLEDPNKPFIHRDLSWLQFNERVLNEARAKENPLLERLRFLGITASNLDEFFMIRFASLKEQIRVLEKSSGTPEIQVDRLKNIRDELLLSVSRFVDRQNRIFNSLARDLNEKNIRIYRRALSPHAADLEEMATQIFDQHYLSLMKEPIPFHYDELRNLSNLQSALLFPNGKMLIVPKNLPPAFYGTDARGKIAIFYMDDVISQRFTKLFGTHKRPCLLRLTRDSDVSVDLEEEDPESIPDYIKRKIRARDQGQPVRLQISGAYQMLNLDRLAKALNISLSQIYRTSPPLYLHGSYQIINEIQRSSQAPDDLVFPALQQMIPPALRDMKSIFQRILERDRLLHHPYDSFDSYVNFVEAATRDPLVESIQITVYRVDTLSKVVELLKKAANQKKIRVVIEPRARFDELNNVQLAEELRQAGARVAFSFGKLKLHAKVTLVERKEGGKTTFFTHLSTGNYNAATARLYTDLSILTAHPGIGQDAKNFFDSVVEERIPSNFKHLILAPTDLHKKLISLINAEKAAAQAGRRARIFAKVNALVDNNLVHSLYEASQAGVRIDLIVRGACALIPKIKGLSDNIRVFSVVDRFLEHSRMYYFEDSNQLFLTSADWMPRNFFSRLEIAFPVLDEQIGDYLKSHVIPIYLRDRVKARELDSIGVWRKRKRLGDGLDIQAQKLFQEMAAQNYRGTPLEKKQAP